jgi:hypothetical protein
LKNNLILTLLLIAAVSPARTETLKLYGDQLMVSVSRESGRFILYGKSSSKEKWTPLIFDDPKETTYFRFYNKDMQLIDFGEGGQGRYSESRITDSSIVYYWKDSAYQFNLQYTLAPSTPLKPADTLLIDLSITGLSEEEDKITFYLCVDTWLGEKSGKHLLLPGNITVTGEREIPKAAMIQSVQSYDPARFMGLYLYFLQQNQVIPDRVYFTNWKRQETQIGDFKVEQGRPFDLKPYSLNDSAVIIEYKKQILKDKTLKYRFMMSLRSDLQMQEVNTSSTTTSTTTTTTIAQNNGQNSTDSTLKKPDLNLINMSLSDLLKLLDSINRKLKSNTITDEDVKLSKEILEEIKRRKTGDASNTNKTNN